MEGATRKTCLEGIAVQDFKLFLERSREHEVILRCLREILQEFKRTRSDKNVLDVLGVGSGGGEPDVQILTELHSILPDVPIRAEIVEGSNELTSNFRALISRTPSLQKIPFVWNTMRSEEYMSQVEATGDVKKFDIIHMIHMIYYVDDLAHTISFFHSLLKEDGILLIVLAARDNGQYLLWKKYQTELTNESIKEFYSSHEVISCLRSLGLRYDERQIPNSFDITECFDPDSQNGASFLRFFTAGHDFHQSFTPEVRAGMLDLLRTEGSTERDGRVIFNHGQSCIIVRA